MKWLRRESCPARSRRRAAAREGTDNEGGPCSLRDFSDRYVRFEEGLQLLHKDPIAVGNSARHRSW